MGDIQILSKCVLRTDGDDGNTSLIIKRNDAEMFSYVHTSIDSIKISIEESKNKNLYFGELVWFSAGEIIQRLASYEPDTDFFNHAYYVIKSFVNKRIFEENIKRIRKREEL